MFPRVKSGEQTQSRSSRLHDNARAFELLLDMLDTHPGLDLCTINADLTDIFARIISCFVCDEVLTTLWSYRQRSVKICTTPGEETGSYESGSTGNLKIICRYMEQVVGKRSTDDILESRRRRGGVRVKGSINTKYSSM